MASIGEAADKVAQDMDCDVFLYSGTIGREDAGAVERLIENRARRPAALLVIATPGGDPDAAYRIGRAFQKFYPDKVSALIPGWCKSAGTLITLAAGKMYVGEQGELGPLDIQVAKQDEIGEAASGLLIETTLRALESTAAKMFVNITKTIRVETGVTTKLAAELSAKMVIGLMTPVYGQIDPMRVGENVRAMNITRAYGMRLAMTSKCLKNLDSLEILVQSYPDHGFVIDRKEARILYKNVEKPTVAMKELVVVLGARGAYPPPGEPNAADYLSSEPEFTQTRRTGAPSNVHKPKARGRQADRGLRSAGPTGARASKQANHANGTRPPAGSSRR
jgi:hypothetical protein